MTSHPRLTIGVPVFRGEDLAPEALESIAAQTFRDFRVVVSVDGNDERSAVVCRRFDRDPRFHTVVQRERLGWAGNINWLARQASTEFFAYLAQDDRLDPAYYETLLAAAREHPDAVVTYSDIQWFGAKHEVQTEPDLPGMPIDRTAAALEKGVWFPFLGLRRMSVQARTGELLVDDDDSSMEDMVWVLKALRLGTVRRIPRPLYFKRLHPAMVTMGTRTWTAERARRVWLDAWMRMLRAALPVAVAPDDVQRIFAVVLKRLATSAPDMDWLYRLGELSRAERQALIADFIAYVLEQDTIGLPARPGGGPAEIRRWTADWTRSALGAWGPEATADPPRPLCRRHRWLLEGDVAAAGWYAREDHPRHGPFRWTGPGTVSEIPLNVLWDRRYRIRIHVILAMPGTLPGGIELLEDGKPLSTAIHAARGGRYLVTTRVGCPSDAAPARALRLAIRVRQTCRPVDLAINDDTRSLGCAVNWIEVEPS